MEVRIPQQPRSIEKKQRILDAGLKVFSEKGYHRTTTTDIAVVAKVSTGLIYLYFEDKRDIFIQAMDQNLTKILSPLENLRDADGEPLPLKTLWEKIFTAWKKIRNSDVAKWEILAPAMEDEPIKARFLTYKFRVATVLEEILVKHGYRVAPAREKFLLALGILETWYRETAALTDGKKKTFSDSALELLCAL